jgi:hypothetical protein
MDQADENRLLEFIYANEDMLIKVKLVDGKLQSVSPADELTDFKYYIFNKSWKMISDTFFNVDYDSAEAIEYLRPTIRDNKMEPGRFWIEMKYWEKENDRDIIITKNPDLDKKYKLYKKYITKNFRLSKDKHYYISPGAYKLYKQGWKMMAGPIVEVVFE